MIPHKDRKGEVHMHATVNCMADGIKEMLLRIFHMINQNTWVIIEA